MISAQAARCAAAGNPSAIFPDHARGNVRRGCSMIFDQARGEGVRPVWVALAVAAFGIAAMLVVDHGPSARPHPQNPQVAIHQTTGEAARSAGAAVQATPPRAAIEPEPPGPKQADPPNPEPD
jgi:hypothetical protein